MLPTFLLLLLLLLASSTAHSFRTNLPSPPTRSLSQDVIKTYCASYTPPPPPPNRSPLPLSLFRRPSPRGGAVPGWAAYNTALTSRHLLTKSVTSLIGWGLGDVLAAAFIVIGPFDVTRLVRLVAFG